MTDREWNDFRAKVETRRRREEKLLEELDNSASVLFGAGVFILLCVFCWLIQGV